MTIASWVEDEFRLADLGDARLNRRLRVCVHQFSRIAESTPHACQSTADLKATYRFASNSKVDALKVFSEHNRSSRERTSQESLVFLAQDTTEVELTKPNQQVQGAGPMRTKTRRGFFFHPLYALSHKGQALGVVDQIIWARDDANLELSSKQKKALRQQACFEEKESCRWLEMQQSGEQLARSNPQTTYICLGDSEADICELFCETAGFPDNYHLIVRGCHARNITEARDSTGSRSIRAATIDEALSEAEVRFHKTVAVGGRAASLLPADQKKVRKQPRESREVALTVRAITVTIAGPGRPGGGNLDDVTLNVVEAIEEHPPEGEVPVRWVLLTTLAINTNDQIEFVLTGYGYRWTIETYFKTLKSGLRIEKLKYETLDRYLVAFAMLSVVAWRVEYIKTAARFDPEGSCENYFSRSQWVAIKTFVTKSTVDSTSPPTISVFLLMVAQLGGYINKKSQGPPGSQTIWRGMAKFETIVEAFEVFSKLTCGV